MACKNMRLWWDSLSWVKNLSLLFIRVPWILVSVQGKRKSSLCEISGKVCPRNETQISLTKGNERMVPDSSKSQLIRNIQSACLTLRTNKELPLQQNLIEACQSVLLLKKGSLGNCLIHVKRQNWNYAS